MTALHWLVVCVPSLLFGMMQGRRRIGLWRAIAECVIFAVLWGGLWHLVFTQWGES